MSYINWNVSGVNRLRPGPLRLPKWKGAMPPRRTAQLTTALRYFSRYMGLKEIPAPTIEKLRSDPHFKYAFFVLVNNQYLYDPSSFNSRVDRQDLLAVLKDPAKLSARLLFQGIDSYINNFPHFMPGGFYRNICQEDPEAFCRYSPIIAAIDTYLQAQGKAEEAITLKRAFEAEINSGSYENRLQFYKLCLGVFNILVGQHHFDPQVLWT